MWNHEAMKNYVTHQVFYYAITAKDCSCVATVKSIMINYNVLIFINCIQNITMQRHTSLDMFIKKIMWKIWPIDAIKFHQATLEIHLTFMQRQRLTSLPVQCLCELVDWWRNLETLHQDRLLSLHTDVLGPSHEATQVTLWLDVLT